MESESDLITIRDEVFKKIGRNLLNFQKIEFMLKHLITYGRISGYMSELKENQERRAAAVHKQTMGNLVGKFIDNTLLGLADTPCSTTEHKELYFSFSFTVNADHDFYENKRQALKSLVDDRNDLIHHLLPRFNPDSIESCLEIEQYLDQQREKLIPEYDHLNTLIESLKIHADYLNSNSEEVIKQFKLSFLQQSSLVTLLLNISVQQPRSDGWTLLSNAGQQLRLTLPEEMGRLKSGYGCKNIKELIRASELFDIHEEPTNKGGVRVLYRPKPEIAKANSAFNCLMNSLLDISRRAARADGWTVLNTAGQEIEQLLAEDLALVKEKWGYESLKELIMASELFDVAEEQVDKNNICELFRPKAELLLH